MYLDIKKYAIGLSILLVLVTLTLGFLGWDYDCLAGPCLLLTIADGMSCYLFLSH